MSLLLYNLFLFLYGAVLKLAAYFNPKAKLWVDGRKDWESRLGLQLGKESRPIIWMHCASLGEFEQGRPVLEQIRKTYPEYCLLISFFSPSGYEIRKNYAGADIVCYLPLDGLRAAKRFIGLVNPALVIWVRYEFWYHFLSQLKARDIKVLLISGLFRGREPFFKWYGKLHRYILTSFTHLFVQNQESAERLQEIGITNVSVSGDTRYDRVSAIASHFKPLPEIERFITGKPVLVAGSTWPEDEEVLDHFINKNSDIRLILAPHEIGEAHLRDIEKLFHGAVRYSRYIQGNPSVAISGEPARVLIIDNIGMLSSLYHYATIAYIGGGFGEDGLHNILEAAVYGVPVLHGPVYEDFPEAVDLLKSGGSFAVNSALELESRLEALLQNAPLRNTAAEKAGDFVANRKGATETIMTYIQANRLLTS